MCFYTRLTASLAKSLAAVVHAALEWDCTAKREHIALLCIDHHILSRPQLAALGAAEMDGRGAARWGNLTLGGVNATGNATRRWGRFSNMTREEYLAYREHEEKEMKHALLTFYLVLVRLAGQGLGGFEEGRRRGSMLRKRARASEPWQLGWPQPTRSAPPRRTAPCSSASSLPRAGWYCGASATGAATSWSRCWGCGSSRPSSACTWATTASSRQVPAAHPFLCCIQCAAALRAWCCWWLQWAQLAAACRTQPSRVPTHPHPAPVLTPQLPPTYACLPACRSGWSTAESRCITCGPARSTSWIRSSPARWGP